MQTPLSENAVNRKYLQRLCNVQDLKPGEMKAFHPTGFVALALYNIDGEYMATSNLCTHQVAFLTDGYLDGDCIECPMHGGSFNVRTGAPMSFPCTVPLLTFPIRIEQDQVWLQLPEPG